MDDTIAEVARGLQDMVRVPTLLASQLPPRMLHRASAPAGFVGRSLPSPCWPIPEPHAHALQLTLQGGGSCSGGGGAYSGKGVSCAGGGVR